MMIKSGANIEPCGIHWWRDLLNSPLRVVSTEEVSKCPSYSVKSDALMLSHFNCCHIKFRTGRKMAWSWPEMNLSSIASRKMEANTSWSSTTPRRRTVGTTRLRPMEASLWLSCWCRVSPPRWNGASLQPHISHLHDSNHVTFSLLALEDIVYNRVACFLRPRLLQQWTITRL